MLGYPQIVITGDSISQMSFLPGGYGTALKDELNGRADVVNRGMGGYNSRQLLRRFKESFVPPGLDIRLFIIHVGTNDSAIGAIQTVPVMEYQSNLRGIVSLVRTSYPLAGVILLTPSTVDPPVLEALEASIGIPSDLQHHRTPENSHIYATACLETARELELPCIDCFTTHGNALARGVTLKELFTDGLHYSPEGYSHINNALLDLIATHFPSLTTQSLPFAFPDFFSYDREDDPLLESQMSVLLEIKAKAAKFEEEKRKMARKQATIAEPLTEVGA